MYVLSFDDPAAADINRVGGKGANLSVLTAAGFPVPSGFFITEAAYRDFVATDDLARRVLALIGRAETPDAVDLLSAEARQLIQAQHMPQPLVDAISGAYTGLGDDVAVAVRSSATAEDLPEASFAGQQDTYLNVRGLSDLIEHVRRCWASLWTARAVTYRAQHGFDHKSVALAVVVQLMVEPDAAGVLFTANPVTGRRDECVVNSSWGLGESVVSGLVTPDTFVVQPRTGRIKDRTIGHKVVEVAYGAGGHVEERAVEGARCDLPSLTDDQVLRVAELGRRVQAHYSAPQDIEWALCEDELYLLQSRPITTLGPTPEYDERDHWTRAMFVEILPDAPSPVFCSVLEPMLTHMLEFTFSRLGQEPARDTRPIGVFFHQPYLNVRYIRESLSRLPKGTREGLVTRIANPFATEERVAGSSGIAISPDSLRLTWRLLGSARHLADELPQVVTSYYEHLDRHRSLDPAELPTSQIVSRLEDIALNILPPLVAYDFLLLATLGFLHRIIDSAIERSAIGSPELARGSLMSGVTGNLTMESNKAIWRLAKTARRSPAVAATIEDGPEEAVLDRLHTTSGGEDFLTELKSFLAKYGHREIRMDIAFPTWGEDPAPVLRFVRAYLASDSSADPAAQERELASKRREVAAEVDRGLGSSAAGRLVWGRAFRWALAKAEALGRERDTMHFHWTAAFPVLRSYLRALGCRWVDASIVDRPSDMYCLTLAEIRHLAEHPTPAQSKAQSSCQAWNRDSSLECPVEIIAGEERYVEAASHWAVGSEVLRGVAGSPGRASGTVRVICGPEDFGKLETGDILVAPITNPVWTPLFAVAGAVVTDSGGILSHGAIVAREYGIPAVMGVQGATSILRDGQIATVDGVAGTVVLED